jgi:hypothetical protein
MFRNSFCSSLPRLQRQGCPECCDISWLHQKEPENVYSHEDEVPCVPLASRDSRKEGMRCRAAAEHIVFSGAP